MFNSLLVPLDDNSVATAALPLARILASLTDASVRLLRVLPESADTPDGDPLAAAASDLQQIAAELRAAGQPVEIVVRSGAASREILAEVQASGAELVVMGTHGRGGLQRAVLGSVAGEVLAGSRVPVALVRPGVKEAVAIRRLLVPVDGSPGSLLALGAAAELARKSGARLVLLRVVVPLPLWIYEPTLGIDTAPLINPMWNEDARLAAERYVESVAARLESTGLAVEARAAVGEVAPVIAAAAKDIDADLVVMSTHGLTGPARSLLGSVADQVMRTVDYPVLLVRQRSAERWT